MRTITHHEELVKGGGKMGAESGGRHTEMPQDLGEGAREGENGLRPGTTTSEETGVTVPTVDPWQVLLGNRWSLLLDVVLPVISYQVLTSRGVSPLLALSVNALFPLVSLVRVSLVERTVDALGLVSLLFIAAGLAVSVITGNPLVALVKGSILTCAFGVAFLVSLRFPRPLAFYLGRQMMTGGKPEAIARWDELGRHSWFIDGTRVVSLVWGWGLLLEAGLRVLLAISLATSTFLVIWPVLSYGIYATLLVWTVSYARR